MKTILSILCLLAISICASAQLQVDFGAAAISGSRSKDFIRVRPGSNGAMDTSFTKYTCEVNGGGIFIYPKYEVKQMGAHSITIGFPIMIGSSDSEKVRPICDINMAVDINGGRANAANTGKEKWMGYYFGAGIGYISSKNPDFTSKQMTSLTNQDARIIKSYAEATTYFSTRNFGLMFHAGIVVPFAFRKSNSSDMGLQVMYKPGFGKQLNYVGLGLFMALKGDDEEAIDISGCFF